ncbi:MAG: DPP IV N-terminal domain-containing protein [Chitinophagales bacterium]|nr:DPP IV N-terminal domain-containing protein [Chitinophagales bacterium]
MKNKLFIIICLIGLFGRSNGQQLTMNDAVLGLFSNLRVDNLAPLDWIPNQEAYTETVTTSYGNALIVRTLPDLKTDTIMRSTDIDGQKFVPRLNWIDPQTAYFRKDSTYMYWNRKTGQITPWVSLPANAEEIYTALDTRSVAYVLDHDLYLMTRDGQVHRITHDGNYEIVNGRSVHREEFGINHGIFFSPKGNYLAFYRMDQSMVEDYPIVDWSVTPAVNKNIKYPFAGRTSHEVTVGVYHPKTKKTIFLQTGMPKDQFLTNVTWAPDEKLIYIQVLNRDQNHMQLNAYDAATGVFVRTLFEERDDKYVEPQHELYFLPGDKAFVFWSQRDGWMHLYRYNQDGKLLNQITKGDWLVNEIVGRHDKNKELLITATKDGAMEKHLYAVNWTNGQIRRIDTDPGYHVFKASTSGNYVVDTWTNADTPRKIDILSIDQKYKRNLLTASNPLQAFNMPDVRNVTLFADDGTELFGKLITPPDMDTTQKHPVIVYLYNGPHAQMNLNRFPASGNLWYDYMAQRGYVVWVMDGRGSSNRGLKFEQSIFRQLGKYEMEDQMKGVEYLKSLPFVDGNRMGIHGWSYGGFMTTSFMLRQPDVFQVGVAGGPVLDWKMYEIMYGERYMDTPESNPEGYAENLLMDKTKNLKGKLLLIHGAQDNVVVWQHSVNFLRNAVANGVQVDYFIYPGYEHNVRGKDRVHLMQKISDYFDLYLRP